MRSVLASVFVLLSLAAAAVWLYQSYRQTHQPAAA